MVPSLRNRHRVIWMVLAFLLPIGFALAVWSIPNYPGFNVMPAESNNEDYCKITYSKNSLNGVFVSLELLKPIISPAPVLKAKPSGAKEFIVLGGLGAVGDYKFKWGEAASFKFPVDFRIEDLVTEQVVTEIKSTK